MECKKCKHTNHNKAKFCVKCGMMLKKTIVPYNYNTHVNKISIFFFTLVAFIVSLHFIDFEDDYLKVLLTDSIFAVIVILFYFIDFKAINELFRFKKLDKLVVLKIVIFAPLFALLVSLFVSYLNESVFEVWQVTYYETFRYSPAPLLLAIISVGVFPAIFEEIAFRGIIFKELTAVTRIKSTILISAVLFTILHFSLISILWLFPIGLLFGYFRAKYRTIWYGVIGHFVYNSSIVLIELYFLN